MPLTINQTKSICTNFKYNQYILTMKITQFTNNFVFGLNFPFDTIFILDSNFNLDNNLIVMLMKMQNLTQTFPFFFFWFFRYRFRWIFSDTDWFRWHTDKSVWFKRPLDSSSTSWLWLRMVSFRVNCLASESPGIRKPSTIWLTRMAKNG